MSDQLEFSSISPPSAAEMSLQLESPSASPPLDYTDNSKSRLVRLAPELFERIAENLPKDILALRLTCREARDKCNHTFINKFRDIAVLPASEASLDAALTLVRDPKLGVKVQNVAIMIDEYAEGTGFVRDKDYILRHRALRATQDDLREKKRDIQKLSALFSTLRARGVAVTIEIIEFEDRFSKHCVGWHSGIICGVSSLRCGAGLTVMENEHAMHVTTQALVQSGLTPERLVLSRGFQWTLPLRLVMARPDAEPTWTHVLSTAKSLDMTSWRNTMRCDETDPESAALARKFANIVASAPKLENLQVSNMQAVHFNRHRDGQREKAFINELLRHDLPNLKSLEVDFARITFDTLVDFVKRHQKMSLVHLRLSDVSCENDGEWCAPFGKPIFKVGDVLKEQTGMQDICTKWGAYFVRPGAVFCRIN